MQTTHGGPATTPERLTAKQAARQFYRDRRHSFVVSLTPAMRDALDRRLAAMMRRLACVHGAGPIASYASIGDEIDPQHVEAGFGPRALPRIVGRRLTFHLTARNDLVRGPLGIPQPRADAPEITPALLLVPLIAATPAGVRLGQGGGFYDRTLARLRGQGSIIAVGLAWECQIADLIPSEPHDQLLDWIATPERLVECAASR